MTTDQLQSVNEIWYPTFAKYDTRFNNQIEIHEGCRSQIAVAKKALDAAEAEPSEKTLWQAVSDVFRDLHEQMDQTYDAEEAMSNELGHKVPIEVIKELEKQQEERRKASIKTYGHLWCGTYLLKSMKPHERAIFPPGMPKLVVNGLMSGGSMAFRR